MDAIDEANGRCRGSAPASGPHSCARSRARGTRVFAAARSATQLHRVGRRGGRADRLRRYRASRRATTLRAASAAGALEIAVFNAGAFVRGSILETDPKEFRALLARRHTRGILGRASCARRMLERGAGTILFTGATASLRGGNSFVNLAAPKFGLRAVAQSMARELGPKGIHVAHVIIDGQIHSGRYAHLLGDADRIRCSSPTQSRLSTLRCIANIVAPGRRSSTCGRGARSSRVAAARPPSCGARASRSFSAIIRSAGDLAPTVRSADELNHFRTITQSSSADLTTWRDPHAVFANCLNMPGR